MGLGLDFRPLLLSIIHFEKDTSERNRNAQKAKNSKWKKTWAWKAELCGMLEFKLSLAFCSSETKTHSTICAGFVENSSPQANKCKLSNHVGTAQCFHTHRHCLHYFNFYPSRIISNYYSSSICILFPLFHFLCNTCRHTPEVNKKPSWGKKKKLFNKRGLMLIFKSAIAFILTEKAFNSDTEKEKTV